MFDNESFLPFQNGRNIGLKKGVDIGRQQGYDAGYAAGDVDGWNNAILECNPIIDNLTAQCAQLASERDKSARELAELQQNYAALSANRNAAADVAREYKVAFACMQTVTIAFYQQLKASPLTLPAIKEILQCIQKEAKQHNEPLPWEVKKIKEVLPKLVAVFDSWRKEAAKSTENDNGHNL